MKDVGKTLRPMGFKGSRNVWTCVTPNGKVTIYRSSDSNRHDTGFSQGAVGFMLCQRAIPEAWWRYRNWQLERQGQPALELADPNVEAPLLLDSYGLPDKPVSPERRWSIRPEDDAGTLTSNAEDLAFIGKHLTWAVERLAARGLELIEPARYLKELLNLPKRERGDWEPIVVFLAEYGPSSALDEAIAGLTSSYHADFYEPIVEYARSR